MENVAGLARLFNPTLRKIAISIRRSGYDVHVRLLNACNHGIPQRRQRVFLVGVRMDSMRHPFVWPTPVPLKRTAKSLLDRTPGDKRLAIPRERH